MLLPSSAAYRLWAPHYDAVPNPLLALEERLLGDLLPTSRFRTVIDVGCGTGRSMLRYNSCGAMTFGADASEEMLAVASKKPNLRGKVVHAAASHLPFPTGIADLAICSFTLSYLFDLSRCLHELARITKHGGQVIISDLHSAAIENGWTRSFRVGANTYEIEHARRHEEEILRACKDVGLAIQISKESGFSDPEKPIFAAAGKEHLYPKLTGTPAVRVIVCRKL
jgi:ubiquinone/menaquinone biosynthesis C-methylase UbiE